MNNTNAFTARFANRGYEIDLSTANAKLKEQKLTRNPSNINNAQLNTHEECNQLYVFFLHKSTIFRSISRTHAIPRSQILLLLFSFLCSEFRTIWFCLLTFTFNRFYRSTKTLLCCFSLWCFDCFWNDCFLHCKMAAKYRPNYLSDSRLMLQCVLNVIWALVYTLT